MSTSATRAVRPSVSARRAAAWLASLRKSMATIRAALMTHPQTALMAAGCVRQVAEHDIGHSAETSQR